jgi:hypothetical protein
VDRFGVNVMGLPDALSTSHRYRGADLSPQRVVRAYIANRARGARLVRDFAPLGCSRPQSCATRAAEAFGGDAQLQSRWAVPASRPLAQ